MILFDFFGTLVTYEPDRSRLPYPATHEMARSLGYRGDHDRFAVEWHAASTALEVATAESMVEYSMTDAAVAFAGHCDLTIGPDDAVRLGASYLDEWRAHVRPVEGAAAMLHRLAGSCRLGVLSNTHDPHMVPSMLDAMGVADTMSLVVLSVDNGVRKPHPSIYARCLDELVVRPDEVLFVGDSQDADYDGPRRAGMHARLIGSAPVAGVPDAHRIHTVLDTEAAVAGDRPRAQR